MSVSCWTVIANVMHFWVVFFYYIFLFLEVWKRWTWGNSTYHGDVFKISAEIKDCHSQHLRICEWHFEGLDVFFMEDGWAAALQAVSFLPSLSEGRGCTLPGPARAVLSHLQRVGGMLSLSCCSDPCCWTPCQKRGPSQMAVGLPLLHWGRNIMKYK